MEELFQVGWIPQNETIFVLVGDSWCGILVGLIRNKRQKMGPQSCSLSMVDIQVKYLISHGTHVKTGLLLVLQKTTYFKYGRWLKKFTTMKMICLQRNPRALKKPISRYEKNL